MVPEGATQASVGEVGVAKASTTLPRGEPYKPRYKVSRQDVPTGAIIGGCYGGNPTLN